MTMKSAVLANFASQRFSRRAAVRSEDTPPERFTPESPVSRGNPVGRPAPEMIASRPTPTAVMLGSTRRFVSSGCCRNSRSSHPTCAVENHAHAALNEVSFQLEISDMNRCHNSIR